MFVNVYVPLHIVHVHVRVRVWVLLNVHVYVYVYLSRQHVMLGILAKTFLDTYRTP